MSRGRIEKALSGFYYVRTPEGLLQCRARGKFRREGISPLVGDWVQVRDLGGGEGFVEAIEPRQNRFARPAAANIDQLVIIGSQAIPTTDPYLIDRIASIAVLKGCRVLLCLNKCDLDPAQELYDSYAASAIPVLRVSAATGEGLPELRRAMKGKLNALTGNSGVGKSSILNAMEPVFGLLVGEVSKALGRGRHTTRHVEMFPHAGLLLLRHGGVGSGAEGPPAGDLPGVCPLSGPVPVRGVQPCEGKGLRRAAGGEGREDPRQPPPQLCAAV